jgi:pimeloyl-ACP methyl ester carboxylesterase
MPAEIAAEFAAVPEPDWSDSASVVENLVEQERLCAARTRPFDVDGMRATISRAVRRSHDIRACSNHFMIDGRKGGRDRLGEITVPTLVLHGDEDPVFPHPHGVALAAAIPGARLVTLSQVGHELPRPAWDVAVPEILRHTAGS